MEVNKVDKYPKSKNAAKNDVTNTKKRNARPPHFRGRKMLISCIDEAMYSSLRRFGFHTIDIIANWERIVGERMFDISSPIAVKFPQFKNYGRQGKENGILECGLKNPAYLMELQMQKNLMIEKLNVYFGYRAISDVKFVKFSDKKYENVSRFHNLHSGYSKGRTMVTENEMHIMQNALRDVQDCDLKDALIQMCDSIFYCS